MDKEPSFELEPLTEPVRSSQEQLEEYTYVYIGEVLAKVAIMDFYLYYNQ